MSDLGGGTLLTDMSKSAVADLNKSVKLLRVHSPTFDPELRYVIFTLISFMAFPAILNALQPFQICILNRKYSKLTFSIGPQLMGKKGLWQICMDHCTVHAKVEFEKFPPDIRSWGDFCQ